MNDDLEFVIADSIDNLVKLLKKERVEITARDVHYSFLDREEYIYIDSTLLYEGEDVPPKFGVYRGYAGGGIHSGLSPTQIHWLAERRKPKAKRLLAIFKQVFNETLENIDKLNEEQTGKESEPWESAKL